MPVSTVSYCKKCGAPIRFIDLPSGKKMPVDAAYYMIYETWPAERYYTEDGRQVQGVTQDWLGRTTTKAWRPHFATCKGWRKKR